MQAAHPPASLGHESLARLPTASQDGRWGYAPNCPTRMDGDNMNNWVAVPYADQSREVQVRVCSTRARTCARGAAALQYGTARTPAQVHVLPSFCLPLPLPHWTGAAAVAAHPRLPTNKCGAPSFTCWFAACPHCTGCAEAAAHPRWPPHRRGAEPHPRAAQRDAAQRRRHHRQPVSHQLLFFFRVKCFMRALAFASCRQRLVLPFCVHSHL